MKLAVEILRYVSLVAYVALALATINQWRRQRDRAAAWAALCFGGQAGAWDSLGYAHHHLGHHTHAADCYQHALTLLREVGDHYNEATTLIRLGDTHHAAGRPDQARAAWTTALTILTNLDHPDADQLRVKIHGLNQCTPTHNEGHAATGGPDRAGDTR